jgi:hypothetical protein
VYGHQRQDLVEAYGLRHLPGGYDWVGDQLCALNRLGTLPAPERVRATDDLSSEGRRDR